MRNGLEIAIYSREATQTGFAAKRGAAERLVRVQFYSPARRRPLTKWPTATISLMALPGIRLALYRGVVRRHPG